jgi:hypothetical protein
MTDDKRLFLYLDILGFSELVTDSEEIEDLYGIIDRLNVFEHKGVFNCIVFSDTLLVYSAVALKPHDRSSAIMWMCEFAQDLFYRLIGRDRHFRALLTEGEFHHRSLKNITAFYGKALVDTYRYESRIPCTGLFIDRDLAIDSNIFKTTPFDDRYAFVHLMQNLDHVSFARTKYPITPELIIPMGLQWPLAYDLSYLQTINRHMKDENILPSVRGKYLSTWQMIRVLHQGLLDTFEEAEFDPRCISDFDWSEACDRVGTDRGFHG